jgi:hypothetical protein
MYMKFKIVLLLSTLILLMQYCTYKNEEDEYKNTASIGNNNTLDSGLVAFFSFEQSLFDSSKNIITGVYHGTAAYVPNTILGANNKALVMNGTDNWLEIPVGTLDTISISMFYKGDDALSDIQKPCVLNYGKDALSLNLDAVAGETYIAVNQVTLNDEPANDWICSFYELNYLYIEAIISKKQIKVYSLTYGDQTNSKEERIFNPSVSAPITLNNNSVIFGCSTTLSSNSYFKGLIDEVRIYNRKLSGDELDKITKSLQ